VLLSSDGSSVGMCYLLTRSSTHSWVLTYLRCSMLNQLTAEKQIHVSKTSGVTMVVNTLYTPWWWIRRRRHGGEYAVYAMVVNTPYTPWWWIRRIRHGGEYAVYAMVANTPYTPWWWIRRIPLSFSRRPGHWPLCQSFLVFDDCDWVIVEGQLRLMDWSWYRHYDQQSGKSVYTLQIGVEILDLSVQSHPDIINRRERVHLPSWTVS